MSALKLEYFFGGLLNRSIGIGWVGKWHNWGAKIRGMGTVCFN